MEDIIKEVRAYTAADARLASCHHFLFDLPLNRKSQRELDAAEEIDPGPVGVQFIVVGLNPAGDDKGWGSCPKTDASRRWHGCEETCLHDGFDLEHRRSQPYSKLVYKLLATWDVVQSELFFWSTDDIEEAFKARFGHEYGTSPHLGWCAERNWMLFEHYSPKAIIVAGMKGIDTLTRFYGYVPEAPIKGTRKSRIALPGSIRNGAGTSFRCLVVHNLTQARYSKEDWSTLQAYIRRDLAG